jgi:hypothetical protein
MLVKAISRERYCFAPKGSRNQAFHRKMFTESRKRFLEAHKNQLDELVCS